MINRDELTSRLRTMILDSEKEYLQLCEKDDRGLLLTRFPVIYAGFDFPNPENMEWLPTKLDIEYGIISSVLEKPKLFTQKMKYHVESPNLLSEYSAYYDSDLLYIRQTKKDSGKNFTATSEKRCTFTSLMTNHDHHMKEKKLAPHEQNRSLWKGILRFHFQFYPDREKAIQMISDAFCILPDFLIDLAMQSTLGR